MTTSARNGEREIGINPNVSIVIFVGMRKLGLAKPSVGVLSESARE